MSGFSRQLGVLMVAAFVDTMGAFLVLALLPFWAERYGASPTMVGLLVAAFALAQTATAPLWGRLSDRVGRRPIILAGLAISAASYLLFAVADSIALLMISRLAQGCGGGTVSVVFAYVSDALPGERRAQGLGWLTSATSLAAMIGPVIGSWSGAFSPAAPGLVAAALSLLTLAIVAIFLPESQPETDREGERAPLGRALVDVLRDPTRAIHTLIWIYAFGMLAFNALTGVVALYLERRFGVTEQTIWIFFTYIGGVSIVMRLFVLGPLVSRFGEWPLVRLGTLLLGVGLLLLPIPDGTIGLAAVVFLVPVATALLFPCTTALISRQVRRRSETGQLLGVQQAFGGASRVLGPLWAGLAFERLGIASPFLLAGAALVGLTLWIWNRRPPAVVPEAS
jgi:multidrug resistance protein